MIYLGSRTENLIISMEADIINSNIVPNAEMIINSKKSILITYVTLSTLSARHGFLRQPIFLLSYICRETPTYCVSN